MKDECSHAVLDYILKEDFYRNYPGIADTIGGFWDHYKARRIAGILGILFIIIYLILLIINNTEIHNLPHYLYIFSILFFGLSFIFNLPQSLYIFSILFFSLLIFMDANRIRNEVEAREYFLILKNKSKLIDLKELYRWNSDYLECKDSKY